MTKPIRLNLDEATHRTAKMLAAHRGESLTKFLLDAILAHCLAIAHKEGLTEQVIKNIEQSAREREEDF